MKKLIWWGALLALAGGIAAVLYVQWQTTREVPAEPAPAQAPPAAEAIPSYPLPERVAEPAEPEAPLPGLDDSDTTFTTALLQVADTDVIERYLVTDGLIRSAVTTIDNLPRAELPIKARSVRPVDGQFRVLRDDGRITLDPENFARYSSMVQALTSIEVPQALDLYLRYYPLLQEAYAELGYPDRQFNDRLIEVLDDLLSTPEPGLPLRLEQPKVFYLYADPNLESRSAGQKILLRIGPEHAAAVKLWLREFRTALTGGATPP